MLKYSGTSPADRSFAMPCHSQSAVWRCPAASLASQERYLLVSRGVNGSWRSRAVVGRRGSVHWGLEVKSGRRYCRGLTSKHVVDHVHPLPPPLRGPCTDQRPPALNATKRVALSRHSFLQHPPPTRQQQSPTRHTVLCWINCTIFSDISHRHPPGSPTHLQTSRSEPRHQSENMATVSLLNVCLHICSVPATTAMTDKHDQVSVRKNPASFIDPYEFEVRSCIFSNRAL